MGDRSTSKGGGKAPARSTSGTPAPTEEQTRAILMAKVTRNSEGLAVHSGETAIAFLEQNSWVLAGEKHTRAKLVDILFTIVITKKLSNEVSNVIKAVAFILENHLDSDLSDTVIKMFQTKINTTVEALASDLVRTRDFINATTKDQAAAALNLRETAINLAATSDRLTLAATEPPATACTWAQVAANGTPPHPPTNTNLDPNMSSNDVRVQQRIQLNARQIMIEPITISLNSPQDYRNEINEWLQTYDSANTKEPGMRTIVRGVHTQEPGSLLLELDSEASATRFREYAGNTDLLSRFGIEANITVKPVSVILRFVPCTGDFIPENREYLDAIENDLSLSKGAILAATWIKNPERRTPNQTVANVKVLCATPQIGNKLLTENMYVAGNRVNIQKDIKEPPRCNNCQEYGHLRDSCTNETRCATCAENHATNDCKNHNHPCCVSCRPTSRHSSSSRNCPIFSRRCEAFAKRYPENTMPYFPVPGERWTWARNPARQDDEPQRPPNNTHRQQQQQPRPQDNGWNTRNQRQTTLNDPRYQQPATNHPTQIQHPLPRRPTPPHMPTPNPNNDQCGENENVNTQ